MADWATIAGNMVNLVKRTNTRILATLKPDSETLENLSQEFHTMLRSREQDAKKIIRITCFAEELPVSRGGKTFVVCCTLKTLHRLSNRIPSTDSAIKISYA